LRAPDQSLADYNAEEIHVNARLDLARITALLSTLMLAMLPSNPVMAHCDSMDGPVVKDAQRALAGKTVDPVLKWFSVSSLRRRLREGPHGEPGPFICA
jgi:hypothetical protein